MQNKWTNEKKENFCVSLFKSALKHIHSSSTIFNGSSAGPSITSPSIEKREP